MRSTTVLEIPTAEQEALLRYCAKPVMGIYSLFKFCSYAPCKIHKAKAVDRWLEEHSRFEPEAGQEVYVLRIRARFE